MRNYISALVVFLTAFSTSSCSQPAPSAQAQQSAPVNQAPKWGMVIHTGAGNFTLAGIAERKHAMQVAPLFDAGKGAFNTTRKPTILFTDK